MDNPCRPGWLWGRYRCYQFITSPDDLTHHEANRKCGELSAELFQPSFNSREDFDTNRDLIARAIDSADSKTFPRQAWIGKLPSCAVLFPCEMYKLQMYFPCNRHYTYNIKRLHPGRKRPPFCLLLPRFIDPSGLGSLCTLSLSNPLLTTNPAVCVLCTLTLSLLLGGNISYLLK